MAGKKKGKPEENFEDGDSYDEGSESWKEDDIGDEEETGRRSAAPPGVRLRDWRDVERFREDRELRRLLEADELLFDDD